MINPDYGNGVVMLELWRTLKAEAAIWRIGALPGLAVITTVVLSRLVGGLQSLELMALDKMMRYRPAETPDDRIVIIGIDEDDLRRLNAYPVPDREIATLIRQLDAYEPVAIGLDIVRDIPVEPGHAELTQLFQTRKNIFGVEKAAYTRDRSTVSPPPALPPEQIGFVNVPIDPDGYVRRSLLGMQDVLKPDNYKLSLSIQLAQKYLKEKHGLDLKPNDRDQMQLGNTELTRLLPNTGGYVNADTGGDQLLLNFRSGQRLFPILSLTQVRAKQFNPDLIRGKIVLIGITAQSVKDVVTVNAVPSLNPGLVNGVEVQAHDISQILSTVLDRRPLLNGWADGWEYLWIVGWGILGLGLGRILRSPAGILLAVGFGSFSLIGISYGFLLLGWWVPIVPVLLCFNGAGLATALFYRQELQLQQFKDREQILMRVFSAIHSGPLQQLALMIREASEQPMQDPKTTAELHRLDQELRSLFESLPRDILNQNLHFDQSEIDLQASLHEVLHQVYEATLAKVQTHPGFQKIRPKIITFEPIQDQNLNAEQKRELCRFLEEALINVGKHAIGATKLIVFCGQEDGDQVIRVEDNGVGINASDPMDEPNTPRFGTQQAQRLAKQLGGKFERRANEPKGTVCELRWRDRKCLLRF